MNGENYEIMHRRLVEEGQSTPEYPEYYTEDNFYIIKDEMSGKYIADMEYRADKSYLTTDFRAARRFLDRESALHMTARLCYLSHYSAHRVKPKIVTVEGGYWKC